MGLVHLHLVNAPIASGRVVDADEVTFVFLGDSPPDRGAEAALRTLAASTVSGPSVQFKAMSPEGDLREVAPQLPDFRDASMYRYAGWIELLLCVEKGPPALLGRVSRVEHVRGVILGGCRVLQF